MQIGRPVGLDFFAGLVMAALVGITPARADEPIFGFIYTTDLLPKDKTEFEQWMTWKRQKAHGSFNLLEMAQRVLIRHCGRVSAVRLSQL
jgi:hypothetical protein